MPSFSSLVFSLKSLQNWPMGIPLWKKKEEEEKMNVVKWRRVLFKMYEECGLTNIHSDVTHVTLCCEHTDSWATVSQSKLHRGPTIWLREWVHDGMMARVCVWRGCLCASIFLLENFTIHTSYSCSVHTKMHLWVCVPVGLCVGLFFQTQCLFVRLCVCVTLAMTECMLVPRARETQ